MAPIESFRIQWLVQHSFGAISIISITNYYVYYNRCCYCYYNYYGYYIGSSWPSCRRSSTQTGRGRAGASFSRCKSSVFRLKLKNWTRLRDYETRREKRTRWARCVERGEYGASPSPTATATATASATTSATTRRGPFNNTFNTFKSSAQCQ